jgi:hypothetical protein
MPHQMCRECHRLVSDAARSCPYCGIGRPVGEPGPFVHLRPFGSAFLLGIGLILVGGVWFRFQLEQLAPAPAPPAPVAPLDPHPGFQSLTRAVWVGAALYGRDDRSYVGRVTSLDCPTQPNGEPRPACLQVEFADGHRVWITRSTAEAKFLTPGRN